MLEKRVEELEKKVFPDRYGTGEIAAEFAAPLKVGQKACINSHFPYEAHEQCSFTLRFLL